MIPRRPGPVRGAEGQTHVRCRLCGRQFEAVTYSHLLYVHRIGKPQAYKDRFGLSKITSTRVRRMIAAEKTLVRDSDLRYLREHWGRVSLREMGERTGRDPATLRAQARRLGLPYLVERWDRAKVERMIRGMRRGRRPLTSGRVRTDDPGLYKAARYYFKSWRNAVTAAGIIYSTVALGGPFQSWSKRRIVNEIRTLMAGSGQLPAYRVLELRHSKLYAAARNYFGNWRRAVNAAMPPLRRD